jgi:hypothetical protein
VKLLCDRISQWEYSSFYEYEVHKEDQYKHGDIPPWNFDYNLLFQTGRRSHPQHIQKRMHNTYILKLVPDNKGRKCFITNDCFYVPLEYDSFDIKHIGDLRYVVGKNQDGIITLWEVKDPVVESKDNLDDDTKLELQDNVNTFIKYLAIEKEMLLTKFTPNEIYNLISKLQKNFVSLEYLFQNKK